MSTKFKPRGIVYNQAAKATLAAYHSKAALPTEAAEAVLAAARELDRLSALLQTDADFMRHKFADWTDGVAWGRTWDSPLGYSTARDIAENIGKFEASTTALVELIRALCGSDFVEVFRAKVKELQRLEERVL